jgi:hypothetical protein
MDNINRQISTKEAQMSERLKVDAGRKYKKRKIIKKIIKKNKHC